ncbi:hypothetical protein [Pseudodesulfovibrio hydrargyri]|uniref:hypothetical protein n=1 Tax=Pseudodesulfovibrio hydrargyri TaxID=2125990 RepID=UPI0008FAE261|nr:hypothetical protein [Pseudodesulfovibrio hydrargyri]
MRIDETNTMRIALTIGKKPGEDEAKGTSPAGGGGVDLSGITSNNMLASNFFDKDYQQSKYATGLLDSLKMENTFTTQLQSLVQQGGLVAPSDMDNYAKRILAADEAASKVEDVVEGEVSDAVGEEVEKNTDEMEEAVDKKIAGDQDRTAQVPTDAADATETANAVESPSEDEAETPETPEVPVVEAAAQEEQPQTQAPAEAEPGAAAGTQVDVPPGEHIDMVI